jgi:hypothetical protein
VFEAFTQGSPAGGGAPRRQKDLGLTAMSACGGDNFWWRRAGALVRALHGGRASWSAARPRLGPGGSRSGQAGPIWAWRVPTLARRVLVGLAPASSYRFAVIQSFSGCVTAGRALIQRCSSSSVQEGRGGYVLLSCKGEYFGAARDGLDRRWCGIGNNVACPRA